MLFNSYIFIFLFLPAVLCGWFFLNHIGKCQAAQVFLTIMSLWFYAYFNAAYALLILGSILVNYLLSHLMELQYRFSEKVFGIVGTVFNLGLLFYFKYYDFFVENVNAVFHTSWALKQILLPLGISFFTFQQLSFILDRMKGKAKHYGLLDYMTFVTYFPQLIAGPIVRHNDLIPQFWNMEKRKFNLVSFGRGWSLFVVGLAKKVLLADTLGLTVDRGYQDVASLDTISALLVMLSYTFQIFFDFSGYCDMAVGIGKMMNISLPWNFDSPYRSLSVREFWKRWHMTLNSFFTEYVYIPLGGNRKGKVKTVRNTMIVFLLSGIWHGANWTFILWGVLHGVMVALGSLRKKSEKCKPLLWMGTFLFVNLAWVLFRSDSVSQAILFFERMLSGENAGGFAAVSLSLATPVTYLMDSRLEAVNFVYKCYFHMAEWIGLLGLSAFLCTRKSACRLAEDCKFTVKSAWGLGILFFLSVISLSGVTTFLYFNF